MTEPVPVAYGPTDAWYGAYPGPWQALTWQTTAITTLAGYFPPSWRWRDPRTIELFGEGQSSASLGQNTRILLLPVPVASKFALGGTAWTASAVAGVFLLMSPAAAGSSETQICAYGIGSGYNVGLSLTIPTDLPPGFTAAPADAPDTA